jgi:plastocyanin
MLCVSVGIVAAAVLTACGGGGGSGGGASVSPTVAGVPTIQVTGKNLRFTPSRITAKAGRFNVRFQAQDIFHTFVIQGVHGELDSQPGTTAGGSFTVTRPGTYTFYCSVPGHRAAGMQGTILVTP